MGNDYQLIDMLVSLQPPLSNVAEIKIRLINDSVAEHQEHFFISIKSNSSQITVPTDLQVADFYIMDDDSKFSAVLISWKCVNINCNRT